MYKTTDKTAINKYGSSAMFNHSVLKREGEIRRAGRKMNIFSSQKSL